MSKKTVLEYSAESNPEDSDILYLIKGLTDRKITLRKIKDYTLGSLNRVVADTAETDSGTILTANGVNELIARVGKLYLQYPFMPTPDVFYGVGTWLNISARAVGYGISDVNSGDPTSYISREDAGQEMDFFDSDLAVDDEIASGTYAGKYIRSVEVFSGDFFRVEGGNALEFEGGEQAHAVQNLAHTHGTTTDSHNHDIDGLSGSYILDSEDAADYVGSGTIDSTKRLISDNPIWTDPDSHSHTTNSLSWTNGTPNMNSDESRPVNRTVRMWIRRA